MVGRIQEDHDNAKYLGTKLNEIDGFSVDMDKVQINMVFVRSIEKVLTSKNLYLNCLRKV